MQKQYTVGLLIKELRWYDLGLNVKLVDDNEVELDIQFVDTDGQIDDVVYIKGYLQ